MCFDYTHGRNKSAAAGKEQSMPKPYTNNDWINDMSIDKKAEFFFNKY